MSAGNCPETPRQKMIGMMYLFYTALLALNVSGEIVNAFVLVNDSLEVTTENFSSKTEGLYTKLNLLQIEQEEKYKPLYEEAIQIKTESNQLFNKIERLKQEIIAKADGEKYDPNNKISVHDIKKKDDLNAAAELMIGDGGPLKGDSLEQWVDEYREFMLGEFTKHFKDTTHVIYGNISSTLGTYDDLKDPEHKNTWQEKLFAHMPLVGSVALMTKLQTDIRNAEADLIERLITGADEGMITITSVNALVSSSTSYVVKGGSYQAEVFIGARDTTMRPTIYYSTKYPFYDTIKNDDGTLDYKMRGELGVDYDTLTVVDGKGIYAMENLNSIGTFEWGGLISWKTKVGEKHLPFTNEYMVGETGFAVSPSGVNVFYRGIDNPVEVSVSGYPKEKVRATMSGGQLVRSGNAYVAKVTSPSTREVTISVSVETDAGVKTLGSKKFRVLSVPVPPAKLNGTKSEGKVHKNDVLGGVLMADLGDQFFPFDVKFSVTSFRFTYKVRGQTNSITVYGNRLNAEAQSALQGLGRGTRISFESIQVQGPSGTFQTAPITLELR